MNESCKNVVINEDLKELLTRGTPGFPCEGYYENILEFAHGVVGWHWHEEIELIAVKSGVISISIGDGSSSFRIEAGEGAFINTNVLHTVRKIEEISSDVISFVFHPSLIAGSPASTISMKFVQPLLNCHSLECAALKKDIPWQKQTVQFIFEAYESYRKKDFGYEILVRDCFSKLWLSVFSHMQPFFSDAPPAPNEDEDRMRQMLTFIHDNYTRPLTPVQIASAASISERECYRCFQRTIRQTPVNYLLQYRIQYSVALLTQTDLTITEISSSTGFNSPSYFTKIFTRYMGTTPRQFRTNAGSQKKTAEQI